MHYNSVPPHGCSFVRMEAKVMAVLLYVLPAVSFLIPGLSALAWVATLLVFCLEKNSPYLRFHALQAFVLYGAAQVLSFALSLLLRIVFSFSSWAAFARFNTAYIASTFLSVMQGIVAVTALVFAIVALVQALKYREYPLPLFGKWARKLYMRLA